ncbi:MAG: hypothetical protein H7222_10300 [Methylotenera sp.]|nr:hypothetical protein [Oligoflexia bacterium]
MAFFVLAGFLITSDSQARLRIKGNAPENMAGLASFKLKCIHSKGDYNPGYQYSNGIAGPVYSPICGYEKAPDAERLCSSSEIFILNPCSFCTYPAYCGLAAGDFGPEQCHCGDYKRIEFFEDDR